VWADERQIFDRRIQLARDDALVEIVQDQQGIGAQA
jgi:hypothetical protein